MVGVRPEGFVPEKDGAFSCRLKGIEVMGRDISILSENDASDGGVIRSIVSAEMQSAVDLASDRVRFTLKSAKVFLFDAETGVRIPFSVK